jgi:NTP pyrophosphatase (non-canonical NTP hydrolase)
MLARMVEELGEVAREVNHLYGNKKKKKDEPDGDLGQELVDMLFTAACIANSYNISIDADIYGQPESGSTPYTILTEMVREIVLLAEAISSNNPGTGLEQRLSGIISPIVSMAAYHDIDLQEQWDRMKREKYVRDKDRYEKREPHH